MFKNHKFLPVIILLVGLFTMVASGEIIPNNRIMEEATQRNDVKSVQSTANNKEIASEKIASTAGTTVEEKTSQPAEKSETDAVSVSQNKAATAPSSQPVVKKKPVATKPATSTSTPKATTPPVSTTPSRGSGRTLTMLATAYDPGPGSNGQWAGISYLGTPLHYGIVAVDPNVIPLGSRLYIEGYGEGYAADTGGAIKGNRIDLCFNTYEEAMDFGMKNVKVTILE